MRTVVTAALLAGLLSVASEGASAQTNGVSPSPARRDALVLRPGDVLRIAVWPNADLGGDFIVEESGLVYLPFLGSIQAAGTTIDDLRIQLRSGYGEAIQNPVVTVSVLFNVGVLGEVGSPGVYQATATTTLIDAIGMAGDFGNAADQEHVRIVRDGEVVEVDAFRALNDGQALNTLRLRSGDHIVVPRRGTGFNWRTLLTVMQSIATITLMVDRVTR